MIGASLRLVKGELRTFDRPRTIDDARKKPAKDAGNHSVFALVANKRSWQNSPDVETNLEESCERLPLHLR
jgi:hypothetical protein